jgi:hypothetical protein
MVLRKAQGTKKILEIIEGATYPDKRMMRQFTATTGRRMRS